MINDLVFKAPEAEGISSEHILEFVRKMKRMKVNLHSFLMARHGNIVAEAYVEPFDKDFRHRIYSCSKSYVSLAVGRLITEGNLSLDDKPFDLMPELASAEPDLWLKNTTVEEALKMSVPMLGDTYRDHDTVSWAESFFSHPVHSKSVKPSGTVYNYNTSGSFILDVLVQKITGMTFLEYLRPVFDKIGVAEDIWCVESPDGYPWGGSGVMTTLRDFAKVAEFLLNKGNCNGEQLISREYMEKATSKQISNLNSNSFDPLRKSGYGYQVWVTDAGFAMLGMGSQLAFCFPERDFIFVCNADTQGAEYSPHSYIYEAVKGQVYDKMIDKALPSDSKAHERLCKELSHLSFIEDYGASHSSLEDSICGKKFILNANLMGWKWVSFKFEEDKGILTYENTRGVKSITFGCGKMNRGTFPETHYYDRRVDTPCGREFDCLFIGNWVSEYQLMVRSYVIDICFGNCVMNFGFKGNEIGIYVNKVAEFFMDDYVGYAGGVCE